MADLVRNAQAIHNAALAAVAGEWVRYTDGENSVRVQMVRGKSEFDESYGSDNQVTTLKTVDWLITPGKLGLEPRIGATITPEIGDGTFEVIPGDDGHPFSWGDGRGTRYRLHTLRRAA